MGLNQNPSNDHFEDFQKQVEDHQRNIKRPTILTAGLSGAGKTSLIQSICGKDVVADDKIVHGKPGTMDFIKYQSPQINIWDSRGLELGQTENEFCEKAKHFIRERQDDPNIDDQIHLVWYAIPGPGGRVFDCDKDLITDIFKQENVIITITKEDIASSQQKKEIVKELTTKCHVPRDRIVFVSSISTGIRDDLILKYTEDSEVEEISDATKAAEAEYQRLSTRSNKQLMELVELSNKLLPEAYRDAFIASQIVDLEKKQVKAQAIIHTAVAAAAAAGGFPTPLSDAAIIVPAQMTMLVGLAYLYGIPKEGVKASMLPVLAEQAGVLTATSLIKVFPGIGSMVQAAVAATLTEALGQVANIYLKNCFRAKVNGEPLPEFHFNSEQFNDMVASLRKKKS